METSMTLGICVVKEHLAVNHVKVKAKLNIQFPSEAGTG